MTHGAERERLRSYLAGARHEATLEAGTNWVQSGELLKATAEAIRKGAETARDGNGTDRGFSGVTAQAILDALTTSAASMEEKSAKVVVAGQALVDTAEAVSKAEAAEAAMTDLEQPPAYTPPTYSPGYQPTPEQISAEGNKREDAQQKMAAYQTARAQQEATAASWTQKLDGAFLAAIPPMQAIHGEPDPTAPPPSTATDPGGSNLPGGSRPPRGDDQGNQGPRHYDNGEVVPTGPRPPLTTPVAPVDPVRPHDPVLTQPGQTEAPSRISDLEHPSTSVGGHQQSGVTYQPVQGVGAGPTATGLPCATPSATASGAGAAGIAGGLAGGMAGGGMAGGIRAGSVSAPAGSATTRAIGSTARSATSGPLSRSAPATGAAGGARGAGAGAAGARGAGAAGARGAGSAGGRGGSGGRGAASGAGSRAGSRSGGAAGAGRGGRKGDREQDTTRDSLVYDQDWLGDDDVAPSVLD